MSVISIVVPTYQERENIEPLVKNIAQAMSDRKYEIIVVDDNSPDGTAEIAMRLSAIYPIRILSRATKLGLASAILYGFQNSEGGIVGVIDADLQHPPELINQLVKAIEEGNDISIASRHVSGGGIEGWSSFRKVVSKVATLMARPLTKVNDPMSGYFFIRKKILDGVEFKPSGYKLLLEILAKAEYVRVKEIPYIFRRRKFGQSKLGIGEYVRYLKFLGQLYLSKTTKRQVVNKQRSPALVNNHRVQTFSKYRDRQAFFLESESKSNILKVSIGICAYNEEENIGKLINALQHQLCNYVEIVQIIVVSSACQDRTDEIVGKLAKNDQRIELIKQTERKGKASAVNLVLDTAKGDVCILESADTIPHDDCIERLCLPFLDASIGMVGAHPIPTNNSLHFMGFVSHFVWGLHHKLALVEPKLGELVAFRNIVKSIPEDTAVDEASIEAQVKDKELCLKYVPQAIVYNKGPDTVADFIKQRRRIYTGHLHLKKTTGYKVSSMNSLVLGKLTLSMLKPNWRSVLWTPAAIALELFGRLLGMFDFYVKKKTPFIWDIATSTKNVSRVTDNEGKAR